MLFQLVPSSALCWYKLIGFVWYGASGIWTSHLHSVVERVYGLQHHRISARHRSITRKLEQWRFSNRVIDPIPRNAARSHTRIWPNDSDLELERHVRSRYRRFVFAIRAWVSDVTLPDRLRLVVQQRYTAPASPISKNGGGSRARSKYYLLKYSPYIYMRNTSVEVYKVFSTISHSGYWLTDCIRITLMRHRLCTWYMLILH